MPAASPRWPHTGPAPALRSAPLAGEPSCGPPPPSCRTACRPTQASSPRDRPSGKVLRQHRWALEHDPWASRPDGASPAQPRVGMDCGVGITAKRRHSDASILDTLPSTIHKGPPFDPYTRLTVDCPRRLLPPTARTKRAPCVVSITTRRRECWLKAAQRYARSSASEKMRRSTDESVGSKESHFPRPKKGILVLHHSSFGASPAPGSSRR